MSGTRIHVTNIPLSISEAQLHGLFIPFGNITEFVLSPKLQKLFSQKVEQGESNTDETTYADIFFEEEEDAFEAQANMNGFEVFAKFLIVTGGGGPDNENIGRKGVISLLHQKKAIWDEENKGLLD